MSLRSETRDCPETHDGHHAHTDRAGRCLFCRRKLRAALPPYFGTAHQRSELGDAYRRMWDPDWGGRRDDQDP